MSLTRRRFLIGCGTALASGAFGCRADESDAAVYDVCIVGSGFAGTHLGLQLVERGLRTVVVEAGARPGESRSGASFGYTNSGSVVYPVGASRVIGLGGSSNHWTGLLTRLRPADFELRTRFGAGQDWPLSYADLESYYCRAEQLLGASGAPPLAQAEPPRDCAYPRELPADPGLETNIDGQACRFYPVAHSTRGGEPVRLLADEIPRFAAAPGATLLSDLQATRLVSRDGQRVDHLLVRAPDGRERPIRARRFVVAAGVVESARLLLLSQPSLPMAPAAASQLGSHFHIHPLLESQRRLMLRRQADHAIYRTGSLADVYRRRGLNGVDYQLAGSGRGGLGLRALPTTEARAENRIRLSSSVDAHGDPVADLSFGYSERDLRTIAHCNGVIGRDASASPQGMGPVDGYRWHPAGSCRMAASEADGVVDAHNRVFGVDNLFVSGACTFPNSGVANPTATVVALTLRLGDHLVRTHRG
jgi:choline dehydrogenase-like flavoprotein